MTHLAIGVDVGSTTAKVVVVHPESLEILWSRYERHETRQPEKVLELLEKAFAEFPKAHDVKMFITGSGAGPLADPLGAKFVQEVNAVTLAVENLHPSVGSVVELGGQDAKIIIFKEGEDGSKQAICSMNDKCASGTGATIDKCMLKVGMPREQIAAMVFDSTKLHHVAAKCGVFAETDIVNLVKSGIDSEEIINSLCDAIVHQNLSVLTRGNTLRHDVLLLGGPNAYLPFLVECWRMRIPETWRERGYEYPKDRKIDELIYVPQNAEYYAAFGAVCYGLADTQSQRDYKGLDGLREYIKTGRNARLGESAGPPLAKSVEELAAFREEYLIPPFDPIALEAGQTVRGVIGMDGGSTSSKAVLIDEEGRILQKSYRISKGNPIQDTKEILGEFKAWAEAAGATLDVLGFGATGYAADVLEESVKSDANIVETVAHMISARTVMPDVDVICDVGGQDIKVLFMKGGDIRNFKLSNQCSAGNGMLLQAMADQFGVKMHEYADTAFAAELAPKFSYGCAVFLDSDRVNFQKEGFNRHEMLTGLAQVLPKNIWQYVVQVPRLAEFGTNYILQGGTQRNLAAVKAQVDYIKQRVPGANVKVHPHCGEAGAIGAAMETLRVVKRRGHSTFIGLDEAINLNYTTRRDESTTCHFCPNECARTFIDTLTPDGKTSRYISGFSCEKGTVEDKDALMALTKERNQLKKRYPNLVQYEAELAFKHFFDQAKMPEDGAPIEDVDVKRGLFYKVRRKAVTRPFRRSPAEAWEARKRIKIGMPRVLNMYTLAPFFRTYFETVGIPIKNIIFSVESSEEMFTEGGKYGSIDPCYPSKVVQAHIHDLLFKKHHDLRTGPLKYIYFPCVTHVPSWVTSTMDNTACPIVAGAPNVIKAAFTKEVDFFARSNIEYLDAAVNFEEPNLLKRVLFETWGERLKITEDESDFAAEQGFIALNECARILEEKGRQILEDCEAQDRAAVLMVGRPYHSDPGLNHGIPDELQVLGYPILSMRSIPKDPEWLARFYKPGEDTLSISDVWPENYSSNSAQKVWAVKFASRHPNVVLLDLSSFKCGHDAPTYGIIDGIVTASKTPYAALHDVDANKPTGTIKIRTKTYGYTLKRYEERLQDMREKRKEWKRRVEAFHAGGEEARAINFSPER
ncbi:MAG: acyl-CoA dehydratase activase-related protein [Deltaproteobacteria bacterium]|nr:acyl-CoA dehydratase activase-related protein [Deltaproteobacteria bacterium]